MSGEGSKKTNKDQKKQIRIKKTNRDQKKTKSRKHEKTQGNYHEIKAKPMDQKNKIRKGKERKKEVTFSWKMKGKFPSLDPPTRFYFLVGSPCYLPFFFFTSIIVVYLDSFNLDWYPSRLAPMYFFLGTHCGGGAAPSPLHPPTRFFFIGSPCYLLFFLFFISITGCLGSF